MQWFKVNKNNISDNLNDEREKKFKLICENFHPCFRYFFVEKYKSASESFTCKQNYNRSVACTSVIGYLLGIGDR